MLSSLALLEGRAMNNQMLRAVHLAVPGWSVNSRDSELRWHIMALQAAPIVD